MQFNLSMIPALLAAAVVASPVPASPATTSCADEIVSLLNQGRSEVCDVTTEYRAVDGLSSALTQAPKIIVGFSTHFQTLTQTLDNPKCQVQLCKEDQEKVCSAFETFIKADQELLNTAIAKAVFFKPTPLTAPIVAAARGYESWLDALAFSVLNSAPICGGSFKQLQETTLDDARQFANTYL